MLTHEQRLELAIKFNKERQAGRIAGQIATRNLIKSDELSEEEIEQLIGIYPVWKVGKSYSVDELLSHKGKLYQVIQGHTSQTDWTPDAVPALFKSFTADGVVAEWVQPTGGHDAYSTGDRVMFEGEMYESLINANTWSPSTYPQGWKVL